MSSGRAAPREYSGPKVCNKHRWRKKIKRCGVTAGGPDWLHNHDFTSNSQVVKSPAKQPPMIDKSKRVEAAKLIEDFMSCRITNFEYKERYPRLPNLQGIG
jgi:hypothetical protein